MKKISIIVLMLIVSLSFFGCDNRDFSGTPGEKAPTDFNVIEELGNGVSYTFTVGNNFRYGDGYQGLILGALEKVTKGDKFTVNIAFTVSRDLEDQLEFGFVDPTEAAYSKYWGPLTWVDKTDPYLFEGGTKLKAGTNYSASIDLKAIETASSTAPAANAIVFQTKGEPLSTNIADSTDPLSANNGGVEGPFQIIFTKFIILAY